MACYRLLDGRAKRGEHLFRRVAEEFHREMHGGRLHPTDTNLPVHDSFKPSFEILLYR